MVLSRFLPGAKARMSTNDPDAPVLLSGSARQAGLAQETADAAGPPPAGAPVVNATALDWSLPRRVGVAALAPWP